MVAEPIKLFGIDRMHPKSALQQCLDHRAVRHLDCHCDRLRSGCRAGQQPVTQLGDPRTTVRHGAFHQTLSMGIDQANLMALACPVDTHKPSELFRHDHPPFWSHPDHRDERRSLYWRSKRNLPQDFRRGQPAGVQVLPRWSSHRVGWATPDRSARSGQSESRPVHDRFKGTRVGWG